jgi:hypothetical protein
VRAALAFVMCGCSWLTVTKAPDNPGPPPVACTQTPAAPIVDTVVATAFTIAAAAFLGAYLGEKYNDRRGPLDDIVVDITGANAAVYGATGILSTVSAISGYTHTARCRALNRAPDLHARPRDDDDD